MTKNANHIKAGDTVIFRNWEGIERMRDKVANVKVDEYTGDISLVFPAYYRTFKDGTTLKTAPESTVVYPANARVEVE
jgi:hypothetical protein